MMEPSKHIVETLSQKLFIGDKLHLILDDFKASIADGTYANNQAGVDTLFCGFIMGHINIMDANSNFNKRYNEPAKGVEGDL